MVAMLVPQMVVLLVVGWVLKTVVLMEQHLAERKAD